MKNKIELKKNLKIILFVSICLLFIFLIINVIAYKKYTVNFNNKIEQIVILLSEKYPMLTERKIMEILNSDSDKSFDIFDKYGIDLEKDSIIINNDNIFIVFMILNIIFIVVLIFILLFIFFKYNKKIDKELRNITNYIEQINKKNYELEIDSISEDELSILKNEIYKTTIMLKEACENSNLDKKNLKRALEDISHQLKTPLTSILIMLDNLMDDPDMNTDIRSDFVKDIKREVLNINFFVQSILKLSKFDVNAIHFIREGFDLGNILNDSIKNVSIICELKNIKINVKGEKDVYVYCDYKWQVEAITNILKNCIEHSSNNKEIDISFGKNSVYSILEIRDYGCGISKKDLPHIFERFYKGENSSYESVGIGLSLSKTIIESDNGTISVESFSNGTKFIIKYYKN